MIEPLIELLPNIKQWRKKNPSGLKYIQFREKYTQCWLLPCAFHTVCSVTIRKKKKKMFPRDVDIMCEQINL